MVTSSTASTTALAFALAACAFVVAVPSSAAPTANASARTVTSPVAQAQAQAHFKKAREHYKQGRYRAAVTELEAAVALDPNASELVYNLAIVHEKLADIDDALEFYEQYVAMIGDRAEKDRIEGVIRRLEGARGEAVVAAPASPTTAAFPAPAPSRPVSSTVPAPREKGRWDGWVMGTGAVAGVALLAGGYFGYRAWSDRLGDAPSTGSSTTFANLQNQADRAHREAVFADVGFGVALAAGATSALLYFLRDKPSDHPVDRAAMVPSVVVLPGGATAGLRVGF